MTQTNEKDTSLIHGPEDILHLYQGHGSRSRMGVEVEIAFFDPKSRDLAPMNPEQNARLVAHMAARGQGVSVEASSETLEIASIAARYDDIAAILDDTDRKIAVLTDSAAACGLKRSWFEYLPQADFDTLRALVLDRPRSTAFIHAFQKHDAADIAHYFCASKATHVSVSPQNDDHLLRNVRRLYMLAPFLFTVTDNGCAFTDNHPRPRDHHAGMQYRHALGARGGVPDYIYTVRNGDALIRAHIEKVFDTKLFTWLDHDGNYVDAPQGGLKSFRELAAEGLNTASNFWLAESMQWPDVKIAQLRDADNNVTGHRYEARMFGVGPHQHATAALIVGALSYDADAAQRTDRLLRAIGLDVDNPAASRERLEASYHAARTRGHRGLDIPYGTVNMRDFAHGFAAIMAHSYAHKPALAKRLAPLLRICDSGVNDALRNRQMFNSLAAVKDWQRHYDLPPLRAATGAGAKLRTPGLG